jgi:hypothetical protein
VKNMSKTDDLTENTEDKTVNNGIKGKSPRFNPENK